MFPKSMGSQVTIITISILTKQTTRAAQQHVTNSMCCLWFLKCLVKIYFFNHVFPICFCLQMLGQWRGWRIIGPWTLYTGPVTVHPPSPVTLWTRAAGGFRPGHCGHHVRGRPPAGVRPGWMSEVRFSFHNKLIISTFKMYSHSLTVPF